MLLLLVSVFHTLLLGSPLENAPFNIVGKGWQSFSYGPQNTEAHNAFIAVSSLPIILRITDTSRPGAAFKVFDNDQRILTTPITALNSQRSATSNPLRAYNSQAWSHGHVVLPAGFHQIRVFMRFSPWKKGLGALLAEPAEKCGVEAGRFFLVMNQVDWDSADQLCRAFGGRLADLGGVHLSVRSKRKKLQKAFKVISACGPDNNMAWVKGSAVEGEDDFPGSITAISADEGITGAEWEMSCLSTLCERE